MALSLAHCQWPAAQNVTGSDLCDGQLLLQMQVQDAPHSGRESSQAEFNRISLHLLPWRACQWRNGYALRVQLTKQRGEASSNEGFKDSAQDAPVDGVVCVCGAGLTAYGARADCSDGHLIARGFSPPLISFSGGPFPTPQRRHRSADRAALSRRERAARAPDQRARHQLSKPLNTALPRPANTAMSTFTASRVGCKVRRAQWLRIRSSAGCDRTCLESQRVHACARRSACPAHGARCSLHGQLQPVRRTQLIDQHGVDRSIIPGGSGGPRCTSCRSSSGRFAHVELAAAMQRHIHCVGRAQITSCCHVSVFVSSERTRAPRASRRSECVPDAAASAL